MDEYIKREDALDAVLFALVGTGHQSRAISAIRDVPTADVVPRERFDRVFGNLKAVLEERSEDKAEVAREIFEEIEERIATHAFTSKSEDYSDGAYDTIEWVDSKIAELKKKYTEGEQNDRRI